MAPNQFSSYACVILCPSNFGRCFERGSQDNTSTKSTSRTSRTHSPSQSLQPWSDLRENSGCLGTPLGARRRLSKELPENPARWTRWVQHLVPTCCQHWIQRASRSHGTCDRVISNGGHLGGRYHGLGPPFLLWTRLNPTSSSGHPRKSMVPSMQKTGIW